MAEERSNYSALAQLINAIISTNKMDIIEQYGMSADHIHDPYFNEIYRTIKAHHDKYKTVPTIETLLSIGGVCADFATNLYQPEHEVSDEFIRDKVWEDHIYHEAAKLLQTSADYVNADPQAGLDYLKSAISHITSSLDTIGTDIVHNPSSRLAVYNDKRNNSSWFYPTGFPQLDEKIGGFAPGEDLIVLFARTGVGKEQPLYSKILTPSGWKRMGDMKLGDEVITGTGDVAPVVGIFPQGNKQVYRVYFQDGTYADAGIDHLWKVYSTSIWDKKPKIVTTENLIKEPKRYKIASVPRDLDIKPACILYEPKHLGELIGVSKCIETDAFGDAVIYLNSKLSGDAEKLISPYLKSIPCINYGTRINISSVCEVHADLMNYLKDYNYILECNSSDRQWVLSGICDVCGTYDSKRNCVVIPYYNYQVKHLVAGLVNSLGGACHCKGLDKGEIYAYFKDNPFFYITNRVKWKPCSDRKLFKKISIIEPVGIHECQCIMVDHPDHTYITDGYTITHNTWIMTKMLHESWKNGYNVGLIEPEMTEVKIGYRFDTINRGYSNRDLVFGRDLSSGPDDYVKYIEELPHQTDAKFMVAHPKDFEGSVTVSKIKNWCIQNNIKMLGIDGISYMRDERGRSSDSATMTLTNISADLMELSVELGIPILIVVQSNREGTAQGGKLALENIRDSDGIAYSASKVFGLYKKNEALHIQLLKNRDGESDACLAYDWDINLGRFQFLQEGEVEGEEDNNNSGHSYNASSNNTAPARPERMPSAQSFNTSYTDTNAAPTAVF